MSRRQRLLRLERRRAHARRRDRRAALPLKAAAKNGDGWPVVDATQRVVRVLSTRDAARAYVRARNAKAVA